MNRLKYPVPVSLITKINDYVDVNHADLKEKQQILLKQRLTELWLYIYVEQIKGLDKHGSWDLHRNIPTKDLIQFKADIGGKAYTYSILLNILKIIDVIIVNEIYKVGEFTKSFKVNTAVFGPTQDVEIDFTRILKKTHNMDHWLKLYPNHKKLIQDVYRSSINLEDYFYWLEENIGLHLGTKNKKWIRVQRILDHATIYECKMSAILYNLKSHWFSVTDTGRFYSSCSNIHSVAVPFLQIDGQHTVNIDAKNSQPLLLASLVDHQQFSNDVQQGIFYEVIGGVTGASRSETKQHLYRWVFFNENPIIGKWKTFMDEAYPGLADQINNLKAENPLWHELQSRESSIWIEVAKRLPFVTLVRHDQIVCQPDWISTVVEDLTLEYNKFDLNCCFDISVPRIA